MKILSIDIDNLKANKQASFNLHGLYSIQCIQCLVKHSAVAKLATANNKSASLVILQMRGLELVIYHCRLNLKIFKFISSLFFKETIGQLPSLRHFKRMAVVTTYVATAVVVACNHSRNPFGSII